MSIKHNKNAGKLDYSLQLMHSGKMLLPVISVSIIYYLCDLVIQNNDRPKILLYLIINIYNSIFLPMYLAYINVLRFYYVKKRITSLLIVVILPLLGNFIQYIFMYVIVIGNLFPQFPHNRDDLSYLFFLFPTTVSLIMSIVSYIIFEVIACIIKVKKKKQVL